MKIGDSIEYTTKKGGRERLIQAEIVGITGCGDECYIDLSFTNRRGGTVRLSQITSVRVTTPIGRRG